MKKREICLFVTPYFPVPAVKGGAVETMVENLLHACERDDSIHFTVVSSYDPEAEKKSRLYGNARFIFIDCRCFSYRFCLLVYKAIKKVLRLRIPFLDRYHFIGTRKVLEINPDLVIAEGGCLTLEYSELSRKLSRDRMALFLHACFDATPAADGIFGNVFAISRFVADEWMKSSSLPAENIHILKNCIDTSRFRQRLGEEEKRALREKLGISEGDFVLLFCGRIVPEKGVRELIGAMALCKSKRLRLLIVGGTNFGQSRRTDYLAEVDRLIGQSGGHIIRMGYVDNSLLYRYHSIADLAVVPSVWDEPAGLVAIEAMADGIPVVVTCSGGLPEYVTDRCAVAVERDHLSENLAKVFDRLAEDPEACAAMSRSGAEEAEKYTLEQYHRNFSVILSSILGPEA